MGSFVDYLFCSKCTRSKKSTQRPKPRGKLAKSADKHQKVQTNAIRPENPEDTVSQAAYISLEKKTLDRGLLPQAFSQQLVESVASSPKTDQNEEVSRSFSQFAESPSRCLFQPMRVKTAAQGTTSFIGLAPDITTNMKAKETIADAYYLRNQAEIPCERRALLAGYMLEVCSRLGLQTETLFLSVSVFDRYLARESVRNEHLQIFCLACVVVAAKFEESHLLKLRRVLNISPHSIRKRHLVAMERRILKVLDWDLAVPSALWFLESFIQQLALTSPLLPCISKFLLELVLVESGLFGHKPSVFAAAALRIALSISKNEALWKETLVDAVELQACLEDYCQIYNCVASRKLSAVRTTYVVVASYCRAKAPYLCST